MAGQLALQILLLRSTARLILDPGWIATAVCVAAGTVELVYLLSILRTRAPTRLPVAAASPRDKQP